MGFGKLIVLVAIIAVVWFGFRWLERSGVRLTVDRPKKRATKGSTGPVDLEHNPATGSYEPRRKT